MPLLPAFPFKNSIYLLGHFHLRAPVVVCCTGIPSDTFVFRISPHIFLSGPCHRSVPSLLTSSALSRVSLVKMLPGFITSSAWHYCFFIHHFLFLAMCRYRISGLITKKMEMICLLRLIWKMINMNSKLWGGGSIYIRLIRQSLQHPENKEHT